MKGYIDNYNFAELEVQKYYAPPKSWSSEKIKEITISRIFSGSWLGSRKIDGALYVFLKDEDDNCTLRGRSKNVNGEYINKYDWIPHLHPFFEELPSGTCLIGELYSPSNEHAKTTTSIMNCLKDKAIKRQEKEENKLHYYIFDILAWDGESYLKMKAKDRFDELNSCWRAYGERYHEWAQYFSGKELWDNLQEILAEGGEGIVATEEDSLYQPGKRPSKQCLKVKKELQDTLDCVVIGANPPTKVYDGKEIVSWTYWYNEQTNKKINEEKFKEYEDGAPVIPVTKNWFYGWAGSLKLGLYDGDKLVHIGNLSGITEEVKENWKDYVGKVAEVMAMEIMDNAQGGRGIRHPKLKQFRKDKDPKECIIDQLK